jgi:hypothetical protein
MSCTSRLVALALVATLLFPGFAPYALADEPPSAPSEGAMLGASVSYVAPLFTGLFAGFPANGGPALGVSAGYRWEFLYLGVDYSHAFLTGGTWSTGDTTTVRSDYVGIDFITISSPRAPLAFVTHFSAGYRIYSFEGPSPLSDAASPVTAFGSRAGFEATALGVGVQFKPNDWLRIVPEASFAIDPSGAVASFVVTAYVDLARP